MSTSEIAKAIQNFLSFELVEIGGAPLTVFTLITSVTIVAITLLLARFAEKALGRAFRSKGVYEQGSIAVAGRLLYYLVAAIGLAIALHTFGIQLSALFAAGAVFAVGLGFGLQNVVQNFVSGIMLLGERSIKPNDVLEVEGRMVRVTHMGLRATIARTLDEEDMIIPNSVLVQSTVKNYTMRDQLYRIRVPVGVVYSANLDEVFEVLNKLANNLKLRSQTKPPQVVMEGFGASSIDFEVSVWIDDPWPHRRARSDVAHAIWRAFKDADIVIAFPQLDVHFDPEVLEVMGERTNDSSATA